MAFFHLGLFLLISCGCAELEGESSIINDNVEGYYWREYTGTIPRDALPGGLDANGSVIFIGQVLHKSYLYPGQIRQAEKSTIYYDSGHSQQTATKYIKILCSPYPKDFEWIRTNNSNIRDLTDKHLILGGYDQDPGYTIYIGRLSVNKEILVGMVIVSETNEAGLHVVGDGKATTYDAYEVLSYNPKVRFNPGSTININTGCGGTHPNKIVNLNIF